MGYFKAFFLLCWCLYGSFSGFAQIRYRFSKDTLSIRGGETFSNMLTVENPYAKTIVLRQENKEKGLSVGLINLPDSLLLEAGETRKFPLKYMANRQTILRNFQSFGLRLVTADPAVQVQQAAVFFTQLVDVKGLTIDTEESEIYLNQLSNQAQVMVRCANNGFVPITFTLLLTGIPDGLEFIGETMEMTLQPGGQQLLPFLARNKGGSRNSGEYNVTIQAVDAQQIQLAVKRIRILNVTDYRKMRVGQYSSNNPNTVSVNYVSAAEGSSYTNFQANGKVDLAEGSSLDYRFNADLLRQRGVNGLNIYSSYLDYQQKRWGVKLGNIYENLDVSLGGRGMKLSAKFKNKAVLSLLAVENNFLLYSQTQLSPYALNNSARSAAVDYFLERGGKTDRRLTFSHSRDDYRGLNSTQVHGRAGFQLKEKSWLGVETGLSRENQSYGNRNSKAGFAGGLNYTLEDENFTVFANGYYSSPYYTGIRRGLLTTDVRGLRKLGENGDLQARISIQNSQPRYQDNLQQFYRNISKNANYLYELKYSNHIGKLYWSVAPYFFHQQIAGLSFYTVPPENVDWKLSSMRLLGTAAYNGRIHNLSISADYGYTYLNTSERPPAPFQSLRMNGSYTTAFFGFTGFMQLNPQNLTDVISTSINSRYRMYSLAPNVHFNTFKNKLSLQFGGMYNYYAYSATDNYALTGSLRLLTKSSWSLTADVQYGLTKQVNYISPNADPQTGFSSNNGQRLEYNTRQFRFGLEKQFSLKQTTGSKKLELTYFEDHNSNGIKEDNEEVVPGVLVKINGEVALTNSKGTVSFKNMNKEAYTAMVTNTKGWSLQEPTEVFLDKNKHLMVPLVKTQALNGRLKVTAKKYEAAVVLGGIRINAMDANGKIHHTLTDDSGAFCFYLPRNTYTVYVETKGMSFSIENDKEQVLLAGTPIEILTFIYKDERRKIGITRF